MKKFFIFIFLVLLIFLLVFAERFLPSSFFHKLNTEAIEKSFVSEIPTIFRTPGGNLELAGFKATETFSASNTSVVPYFNWEIPFTKTITQIRVPVSYRYHIRLHEEWRIDIINNTCLIYAPALRPTLPPAIHTDEMEIRSEEGLLAWDSQEELDKLLKSMTPQLDSNAVNPKNVQLVREEGRKTVAEFIRTWLLQRGDWGEKKIENIKVIFADEKEVNLELLMPSIEFKDIAN